MSTRDQFESVSPIEYRYCDEEAAQYLSENAFIHYKLLVEIALVKALHKRGVCSASLVKEVVAACEKVTAREVYKEEKRVRHDVRALVNCIRAKVSDRAKPYVHLTATSSDIVGSANALRYKDVVLKVLIPALTELLSVLVRQTLHEAATTQIGRTHGQHAVPLTFGFACAGYVNRLGESIEALRELAGALPGKFSGAVGAYNASALFFGNPEVFEKEVLAELGLSPAMHATQIVPPEAMTRLFAEITIVTGICANVADDMRQLARSEIGEVSEGFCAAQVGSSTMPHKRNPITFENVKSFWKIIVARTTLVFMDQISEHQRDLTNSASARTYGESIVYAVGIARRLTGAIKNLSVDRTRMAENLEKGKDAIIAEPLYILLASLGHPDAHERVRTLVAEARVVRCSLLEAVAKADDLAPYLSKMTLRQKKILSGETSYTGVAEKRARSIAAYWKRRFGV